MLPKTALLAALAVSVFVPLLPADTGKPDGVYTPAERRHWAFQPRSVPPLPQFAEAVERDWAKTPVDAFILARLKKAGLEPAPPADRGALVRRLYFGLTGLPPTPEQADAFVNDPAPDAYEKLVETLLASPRYGERWAQHWLDVIRFAETDGFEYDTHRPDAWRFRDYVIKALNEDKPFNQFIMEQLAGDEMDPDNLEYRTAAGFNRLAPLRKNAGNQEVASSRNEVLTEMTNIVGAAFLGVTVGCARCHDHKFDPIRHKDYYRMQAHFASTFDNDYSLATTEEQQVWKAQVDAAKAEVESLKKKMKELAGEERKQMAERVKEAEAKMPEPLPALYSVAVDRSNPSPIHVLARGDYESRGDAVGMRPLGVLLSEDAPEAPLDSEAPRTSLAKWVVDPENPLTARVLVNRVWAYHFGRGIVATPNDFGRMGTRPSHPELLDYLANQFVENGWSIKELQREILLSNAYRQSSESPIASQAEEKDPENKWVWHFPRRRLEAEEIRDAMLVVAGKLNPEMGGPSIMAPVQQELIDLLYKPSQWQIHPDPRQHNRRSVYLIQKRNLRLPFMEVFDAPDRSVSCPQRESSTHAPQALELMNGDFSNQMADALAVRLKEFAGPDPAKQVDLAYRLATGRAPNAQEKELGVQFLQTQSLREFALAVLNLNAFLYVN